MLGKVSIIVDAAMAQFESDMGRAARVSEKEFKKIERDGKRAMKDLQQEAKNAGMVLGTVLAAGFIATGVAIRNMVKDAEQIRRLSELSGLGAEQFQKLAAGARTVGIENDKLADIYKDMQDRVGDFIQTGGGPMLDFFEQIAPKVGVTIEQFRRLSGPDALQLFVTSLEKANLSQSEMTFYMEAIASDSSLLIPLLRNGGEGFKYWGEQAEQAGAIMGGQTLEATRELQVEMERVRLSVDGMWRQALPSLLPKLKELAELINSEDFREGFQTLINGAVGAIGAMAKLAVTTANVTKFLAESAAAAINGPSADDIVRIEDRIGRIKRAMDALREGGYNPIQMSGELAGIGLPSGKALELNYDLALGNTGSVIASLNGELAKEQNKLKVGMKLADDAAVQAAKLAEEAAKAITVNAPTVAFGSTGALANGEAERDRAAAVKKLSDAELDLIAIEEVWAQGAIDRHNSELDRQAKEAEAANKRHEQAQRALQDIRDQTELLGMSAEQQEVWNNLKWAGVSAESEMGRAIAASTRELQAAREQAALMEDIKLGLADMFVDFVSGAKSAKEAFGDFADMLFATALQFAADQAVQAFFDAFKKGGTSASGSSSSDSSADWMDAAISIFGSWFGGARADGGPIESGKAYLVGERGPEMVVPRSSGMVLPAAQTAMALGGGNGVAQTNHFHYAAPPSQKTQQQTAQRIAFETQRATARNR